jgi:sugar-specific transcriptional regulator TrmB
VWATLSKKGELGVVELSHAGGVHRPSLYRALEQLLKLGLIERVPHGKRVRYRTVSEQVVHAKWKQVEETFVPQKERTRGAHSHIQCSVGREAITEAFDHVITTLKRGDTFYRITSERNLEEVNSYLSPNYRAQRDAKRLERLVISNRESGIKKRSRLERFIRYIEDGTTPFTHNTIKLIYGPYVTYIDLHTKQVTRIQNAHIADFERAQFKTLYDALPRPY